MRKVRFSAIPVSSPFTLDGSVMFKTSSTHARYPGCFTQHHIDGDTMCEVNDGFTCVGADAQDDPVIAKKGGAA